MKFKKQNTWLFSIIVVMNLMKKLYLVGKGWLSGIKGGSEF